MSPPFSRRKPPGTDDQGGGPRTFRTSPAKLMGYGLVVIAVVMAVLAERGEVHSGRGLLPTVAIFLVVVSLVHLLLLRPCVRVDDDGVQLRNLIFDVDIPYASLREIDHHWALELTDAGGHEHSSWAIPVKRRFRRGSIGEDFADATSAGRGSRLGNDAEVVAGYVEHLWRRWQLAGGVPDPDDGRVRPSIAWPAVLPVLVAVAVAVLALLFG